MNLSVFEVIMLVCFGAAWPFSIYKSYISRNNHGKSVLFLLIIFVGYISGIIHKMVYDFNLVIFLYMLNAAMVFIDIGLYFRNKKYSQ